METMKIRVLLILSLLTLKGFSQGNPAIESTLPKIVPPSPTVAALMKFEEVPVDNYVGIPDISIPLYSIGTHSKDININLSLKYHPSSIVADEEAGYTGLGWSLFAGGTISRTVRGLPDESYLPLSGGRKCMYDSGNLYYQYLNLLASANPDQGSLDYIYNQLVWETGERSKYDTEHDLFQFNFMGYNGRFFMTKQHGFYEIIKLDNDNAIQVTYDNLNRAFVVYDDKGNQYVFDAKEVSSSSSTIETQYFGNGFAPLSANTTSYISAYHLSKISDSNGEVLAEFKYNTESEPKLLEQTIRVTSTTATIPFGNPVNYISNDLNAPGELSKLDPKSLKNTLITTVETKKLKEILVEGKARIYFTSGISTDNDGDTYVNSLDGIKIQNWNTNDNTILKKFQFTYGSVFSLHASRRTLTGVIESNADGSVSQSYELSYKEPEDPDAEFSSDYWGYLNLKPDCESSGPYFKTTPSTCAIGALQKMRLPSGGAVIFNWEANTYSYVGDVALDNFDENPDNWDYSPQSYAFSSNEVTSHDIFLLGSQTIYANFSISSTTADGQSGAFWLYKIGANGEIEDSWPINCGDNNGNCTTQTIPLISGHYQIRFSWLNSGISGSGTVDACFRYRNGSNFEFLYGGGIRIKNIGYFENGQVDKQYYNNPDYQVNYHPAKQKDYNYNFFGNVVKSSGSLAFPKPIYEYQQTKTHDIIFNYGQFPAHTDVDVTYNKMTTFNNLNPVKTHGSDVGYRNVTVSEAGNGWSQYTYTSPIQVPEVANDQAYLFMPVQNHDYKRGQLETEVHFNQAGNKLTESFYTYACDEAENGGPVSGLFVSNSDRCKYMYLYSTFEVYYSKVSDCAGNTTDDSCLLCYPNPLPSSVIKNAPIKEPFGWRKMIGKETHDYFYTSSNADQGTIVTKEAFEYDSANKKIKSHEIITYGVSGSEEKIRTDYFYHHDWPDNNMSTVDRIETYKNNGLIETKKIIYGSLTPCNIDTAHQSSIGNPADSSGPFPTDPTGLAGNPPATPYGHFPLTIQTAKGDRLLENRVEFVKYDRFSNLIEAKLEGGIPISYIYGYNKTLPIAMIENATNEQIATALGVQVCDLDNYSEVNLGAINGLRNTMSNVMITTYTYEPLKGVTSITDPKGYITTFEYDNMLRLKAVKDQEGHLLSENEYHYRLP